MRHAAIAIPILRIRGKLLYHFPHLLFFLMSRYFLLTLDPFGRFWLLGIQESEIETITSDEEDMVDEQYGRDAQAQNIILCTMTQDGSQAISDVCYSNASLKHLCGGEMIYAFEMDDSVYKGPKWNPASPMLFKEGDGVDSQGQNISSIMPAPLCHCSPCVQQ